MKEHFVAAMTNLRRMLNQIAADAEMALNRAVKSVAEYDCAVAAEIIRNDEQIDIYEVAIEEECLKILALHQPVAGDLRNLIAVLKINNEIERIGDLAVNIASRVPDLTRYRGRISKPIDFTKMADVACGMLKKTLDAFTYHDVDAAYEVLREDDKVDELHKANYAAVNRILLSDSSSCGYYIDCLTISRSIERAGDFATNIAEDIIYLEKGKIVRHRELGERPNEP